MQDAKTVPGPQFKSAAEALRDMVTRSERLRGAVAFVSSGGVQVLEDLVAERAPATLQVIARGAPITEPAALVRLAELEADVSLVVGARARGFHPKLWLASEPDGLIVLSGSGNLTEGGLTANEEQFEYFRLDSSHAALIEEHEQRFGVFAQHATPLDDVRKTRFWSEWENQAAERKELVDRERELDDRLAVKAGADLAQTQLYNDLLALYERTKTEVRIPAPGGGDRPYVASRFKQAIDRGRREGTLVPVVARIVRRPTEGFEHLADAGRPDLTVEALVLDQTKPYDHLFGEETKRLARNNLDAYQADAGT